MARRSNGYFTQGRAKNIPGGSKRAVERNASSGLVVGIHEMTNQGLLRALSSARGKRAAAITQELYRRGVRNVSTASTPRAKDVAWLDAPEAPHIDGSSAIEAGLGSPGENFADLPGHKDDALGRQRPDYSQPGRVSGVERITVAGERIKRDAAFRARVLRKYGDACVICGYALHIEAAHLTPKHELSDDRVENGAPLCPNHHWELDNGHLSIQAARRARDGTNK